jgi:hypothetical protein
VEFVELSDHARNAIEDFVAARGRMGF